MRPLSTLAGLIYLGFQVALSPDTKVREYEFDSSVEEARIIVPLDSLIDESDIEKYEYE